jgi:mRNA interferase MazF
VRRGELYRVRRPRGDAKRARVFVIVSRQVVVSSRFPTVICAPVFTRGGELSTQVPVGPLEGLKHDSWIMCDQLMSLPKILLTDYVGSLPPAKLAALARSLAHALELATP